MDRFCSALAALTLAFGACSGSLATHPSLAAKTCKAEIGDICLTPRTQPWTHDAACSSAYGGYKANSTNEKNLHTLVKYQLEDSFKYLLMGSHFNRDDVNRMGLHGLLMGYSDETWNNAVSLIKYMTKRGANLSNYLSTFTLESVQPDDFDGEVSALGITLDMWKELSEAFLLAIKHAMNKHQGPPTYFDPSIFGHLERDYLAGYTKNIRNVAGYLNLMGKMAKDDKKTRRMGLHLFDNYLKA